MVGVSGGPDSLCLMDLLYRQGYPVVVAHFNHRLRAEAEQEAREVEALSRRLGLPVLLGEGDVRQYAEAFSLSLEEGRASCVTAFCSMPPNRSRRKPSRSAILQMTR